MLSQPDAANLDHVVAANAGEFEFGGRAFISVRYDGVDHTNSLSAKGHCHFARQRSFSESGPPSQRSVAI
jgi:hypothetical protein